MAILAKALNIIGLIFLSHAVYSAYEHSLLPAASIASPANARSPRARESKNHLPADIAWETLFSVIILCIGVVLSSPELKPIQWNVWAGRLERSKEARIVQEVGVGGGNPYTFLEERPGFVDVRAQRRAFRAWQGQGK